MCCSDECCECDNALCNGLWAILAYIACLTDIIFNMQIPASRKGCVILRPAGKTYVTGLANSYAGECDPAMGLS